MIVVFEGPDGAGKSTMIQAVAEAAAEEVGVAMWRAGPPTGEDMWLEYVAPISTLYPSMDWLVLVDRWHLGELVYGPIFRGASRLSHAQRGWIDGYLKTLGARQVYLTATLEELTRRLTDRGDAMVKMEHLQPILDGYAAVVNGMTRYDTTGQRVEPTAAAIYNAAKQETAIALSAQRHPSIDKRPYWERNPWPT